MREMYYDPEGRPITLMEWAAIRGDNARVALFEIFGVRVSTVWLGINHNWGSGPPLIFETMIFGGHYDELQWRYSTREQALAGHQKAVRLVKQRLALVGLAVVATVCLVAYGVIATI